MSDALTELDDSTTRAIDCLAASGELSAGIAIQAMHAKTLVIAAASRLEADTTRAITAHVDGNIRVGNDTVASFVRNKALTRTYHTMFSWDAHNANTFFSLFGTTFLENAKASVSSSRELAEGVRAFLTLGQSRNALVHGDLIAASLESTPKEILAQYQKARFFADALPSLLDNNGKFPRTDA